MATVSPLGIAQRSETYCAPLERAEMTLERGAINIARLRRSEVEYKADRQDVYRSSFLQI
jgi:hypothetical protein